MIVTGCKNTPPPDLIIGAQPSEGADTPFSYVMAIHEKFRKGASASYALGGTYSTQFLPI